MRGELKKGNKRSFFMLLVSTFAGVVVLFCSLSFPSQTIAVTRDNVKNIKKYTTFSQIQKDLVEKVAQEKFFQTTNNVISKESWFKVNFVVDSNLLTFLKNLFTTKKNAPTVILLPKKDNLFKDLNIVGNISIFMQFLSSCFLISTSLKEKKIDKLDFKEKKINGPNQNIFVKDLLKTLEEKDFSSFISNFFVNEYYFGRNLKTELAHLMYITEKIRECKEGEFVGNLLIDYIFKDVHHLEIKRLLGGNENLQYILALKANPNQKQKRLVIKEFKKIISISGGSDLSSILNGLSRKDNKTPKGKSVFQNFRAYVAKKRIQYFFQPEIEDQQQKTSVFDSYAVKYFVGFVSIIFLLCVYRVIINRILISQGLDSIETYLFKLFASFKNIFFIESEKDTNLFDVNQFIQNDLAVQNLIRDCSKNKVELDIAHKQLELQRLEVAKIKNEHNDYVIDINDRYQKIIDNLAEEMTAKVDEFAAKTTVRTNVLEDSYKKKTLLFAEEMEAKVAFQTSVLAEQLEKNCRARLQEAIKEKYLKTRNFFENNEDETED
jgi:hypothetical protein